MWGQHVVSHYFPCPIRLKKVSLLSLLLKVAVSTASKCQMTLSFFCSSRLTCQPLCIPLHSPFMRTPAGSFAGKIPSFKLHLEPRCSLRAEVVHWEQVCLDYEFRLELESLLTSGFTSWGDSTIECWTPPPSILPHLSAILSLILVLP